jgi:predicted MFS family arabinose efflux permease
MVEVAEVRLRFQLLAFSLTRVVVNTSFRMLYPFLPFIAAGIGVDENTLTNAIALRSSLGAAGPLLGSAGDRYGRKTAMIFGMALFLIGMAAVAIWPTYPALFAALLLTAASKIVFDPTMQAYLGDRVPYTRRGLAIALTEFGWSGAYLLGVPLVGWLIARSEWHSPFLWLALLGAGVTYWLWRILPPDSAHVVERPSLVQGIRLILSHQAVVAALGVGAMITASNETVNIVYGVWMNDTFGLQVEALGASVIVIGVSELLGEGLVGGLSDRLGKRRTLGIGLAFYALACLFLPVVGSSLEGALIGLFIFFLSFEFTLVSTIPLMTELVPGARATLLSVNATVFWLGRAFGALIGDDLFVHGLQANSVVAAGMNLAGLALLLLFVREANHGQTR